MPLRKPDKPTPQRGNRPLPFVQLDYLYVPSADVAKDLTYFTGVLGGEVGFAVEGMGARVALVRLTKAPPHVLLTDHLEGDQPILIYRVSDLAATLADLKSRGWKKGHSIEIPMGPCCSFTTTGGQRIAVYELSRPEVANHFMGRRDF